MRRWTRVQPGLRSFKTSAIFHVSLTAVKLHEQPDIGFYVQTVGVVSPRPLPRLKPAWAVNILPLLGGPGWASVPPFIRGSSADRGSC